MFARSDRGSLPLALMVTILVTGLVSVVTASVVMGQQQTRFDESYERALQVAEHGSDALLHQVQAAESEVKAGEHEASGTVEGGGSYDAELVEEGDALVVRSEGTVGDVTRTVVIGLDGTATSSAGLISLNELNVTGNQQVRSFSSGRLEDGEFDPEYPDQIEEWLTGSGKGGGTVATNGLLTLQGAVVVDEAELWDDDGDEREIDGNWDGPTRHFTQQLQANPDIEEMQERMDERCDGAQNSAYGGETLEAGTHCFGDVTLIEGEAEFEGTPEDPVEIYMTGTLTVQGSVRFDADGLPKPSPSLRIYSKGETIEFAQGKDGEEGNSGQGQGSGGGSSGRCGMGGDPGSRISAVVHAPAATIPPSGAQADVYGSLLINEAENLQGRFCVLYDELLDDLDDDQVLSPHTWREE